MCWQQQRIGDTPNCLGVLAESWPRAAGGAHLRWYFADYTSGGPLIAWRESETCALLTAPSPESGALMLATHVAQRAPASALESKQLGFACGRL